MEPRAGARSSPTRSSTTAAAGISPPGIAAATTGAPSASTAWPKPASTGVRFTPRRLPAKDAAAYVKRSITTAPNRFEAVVTLHAAAEKVASRVPGYWGAIEPIDAHTCTYRTGDDDLRWLALRIAMVGVDFEVHEPPELVEHLRALAARLGRAVD